VVEFISYLGWRTRGRCKACVGTGLVDPPVQGYQIALANYISVPKSFVPREVLHYMGHYPEISSNLFVEAFREIEYRNLEVGNIVMHPQDFLKMEARLRGNTPLHRGVDLDVRLFGFEIQVEVDMPESTIAVLVDQKFRHNPDILPLSLQAVVFQI